MTPLPGITGTLFPGQYLAEQLLIDSGVAPADDFDRPRLRLMRWWTALARHCGPASGLYALFDLVAMPLAAMLGFRAHQPRFRDRHATVRLETPRGAQVGCVILPWAERPSALWRDLTITAREIGAAWCWLVAPPYLSLVDVRGHTQRRSVEFTLPDVFDARSFGCFWRLARAESFEPGAAAADQARSRLDRLVDLAARFQDGVRADLEAGVEEALASLSGVLPYGTARSRVDEALTIVYRVLFLLFAESRNLVPRQMPAYAGAYALTPICRQAAASPRGTWDALGAITRLSRRGCRSRSLRVADFHGRLFARASSPALERTRRSGRPGAPDRLRDDALSRALLVLSSRSSRGGRQAISYRDLGVEQLGAVYVRVLDLDPDTLTTSGVRGSTRALVCRPAGTRQHSVRRKESGTFYTPRALAEFVVRRTLAPLVSGASADRILALRIVDPAMGSGAFLVAACRYLAAAFERALIEEGRAAPGDFDADERADVRRLIAERCLAGVDRNPVAVQLAQLSLWLTTLARGKPLGFLDHRLRTGNSLIGTSPEHFWRLDGRRPPAGRPLFDELPLEDGLREARASLAGIIARRDDTVADVKAKESAWHRLAAAESPLSPWRRAADLWCARWFWPDTGGPAPAAAELRALRDAILLRDATLPAPHVAARLRSVEAAAAARAFFHWPLEFSDVFYAADGTPRPDSGFDAVLANPPWEMLRHGRGAGPESRQAEVRFIRESALYESCGTGHVNLYQPFLDRAWSLVRPGGRVGVVLPWGFAVDDGAAALRRRWLAETHAQTLVGLDNAAGLFPIHRGLRFVVAISTRGAASTSVRARFGVTTAAELEALPDREDAGDPSAYPIRFDHRQLARLTGAAVRIPDARTPAALRLLERLTSGCHPAGAGKGWGLRFARDLNATEHRRFFGADGLPVLEGKHLEPFRVNGRVPPAGRIDRRTARRLLPDSRFDRARLAYRDVSGAANRVSLIAAILPAGTVTTHTVFCARNALDSPRLSFLCGLFNSYVLNAFVRMLMGNHLTTTLIERLPLPCWTGSRDQRRLAAAARRLAHGPNAAVEAKLQAAAARAYRLTPDEFSQVLDGFPLVPAADRRRALQALTTPGPDEAARGDR
jgi:hypothetical protein